MMQRKKSLQWNIGRLLDGPVCIRAYGYDHSVVATLAFKFTISCYVQIKYLGQGYEQVNESTLEEHSPLILRIYDRGYTYR